MQNAKHKLHTYAQGDLVAVLAPMAAALAMNSRKFHRDYVGPLVIDTVIDSMHFKLRDLQGKVLPDMFHYRRLRLWKEYTTACNLTIQEELLEVYHNQDL